MWRVTPRSALMSAAVRDFVSAGVLRPGRPRSRYYYAVAIMLPQDYQLIVLCHGAVMAGMVLNEEARGDDAGRLQRLDEPGAYAKPLRFQAYRLYMVWR